jgi:hypothetical protein
MVEENIVQAPCGEVRRIDVCVHVDQGDRLQASFYFGQDFWV